MIIVIDGVSGSGKSSTAKAVAGRLGIEYLDSGALYRAASWIWLEEGCPENPADKLSGRDIRFEYSDGLFRVFVDGSEITEELRRQRISEVVSRVAADSGVRDFVNNLMRNAVRSGRYIADGRDLGSTVFPDADLKFYMEASLDVRARRRFEEMKEAGESVTPEQVRQNIAARDEADTRREASPLVKPDDAYIIDTSEITFDEQVERIIAIIRNKFNINP